MKSLKQLLSLSLILSLAFTFMAASSAPADYGREDGRDDGRDKTEQVNKKEEKRNSRLNQRRNKLESKMDAEQSVKKRTRIKRKIDRVKRIQEGENKVFSILGFAFALTGFVGTAVGFTILMTVADPGTVAGARMINLGASLMYVAIFAAIIGLVFSIVANILASKNPDKFGGRGFAKAGLLIAIITMSLWLVLFLIGLFAVLLKVI